MSLQYIQCNQVKNKQGSVSNNKITKIIKTPNKFRISLRIDFGIKLKLLNYAKTQKEIKENVSIFSLFFKVFLSKSRYNI